MLAAVNIVTNQNQPMIAWNFCQKMLKLRHTSVDITDDADRFGRHWGRKFSAPETSNQGCQSLQWATQTKGVKIGHSSIAVTQPLQAVQC
jgi:hypothetical protein